MTDYPVYEPSKQCAKCKGQCCKRIPGHYSPTDFKDLSFEGLKAEIEKGGIAIDWWEAETREYYLRARQIGEEIVHGSWGGICVNLTPTGCRLPREERPLACNNLKPGKGARGDCEGTYTKEHCKNDWKAYSDVLCELVEYFGGAEDSLEERMNRALEALNMLFGPEEVDDD